MVTNTLAYYDPELIKSAKRFVTLASRKRYFTRTKMRKRRAPTTAPTTYQTLTDANDA